MATDNVSMWTSAGIWLLTAFLGAAIGTGATQIREWFRERQQKDRIEKVLVTELLPQADVVTIAGSLANFGQHGLTGDQQLRTALILSQLPPEPTVYKSLVGQLPLLAPRAAASLVGFHGSVELARRMTMQYSAATEFPRDHLPVMGAHWRAAARNALRALQDLQEPMREIAEAPDLHTIDTIRGNLRQVVEGRWPRLRIANGTLQITAPAGAVTRAEAPRT